MSRTADGSAGDADYGTIGAGYARLRQPEPAIMAALVAALGDARTVLNVGAGAGSYEPADRVVTAVEPSRAMRDQRPPELAVGLDHVAEALPFDDDSFDASMATFTVHQWTDLAGGLRGMRRVTSGPVVILSCDPAAVHRFWLADYAPDVIAAEARRYPPPALLAQLLGGTVDVLDVPVPLHCRDGFGEAYYGRPERLLDPATRAANSAWSFVDETTAADYVARLAADLESGAWDDRHAALRTQPTFAGSLRLIIGR